MRNLLLLFVFLAACSSSPTQLLVEVDTDFAVPSALSRVDVRTEDEAGALVNSAQFSVLSSGSSPESGRYVLPISFGVVPKDGDANRTVLITVEGRLDDSDAVLVERRARVRFREGETIPLSMFLSLACASKVCGEDETCDRGECIPVDVEPGTPAMDMGVAADLGDADMGVLPDDAATDAPLSPDACVTGCEPPPPLAQEAYLKASNTGANDSFGYAVALSADGSTLAIGATGESSVSAGVGGDQANDSASAAGAVYVFVRAGADWAQQAYIKASNPSPGDFFGISVALSSDGSRLAVGATREDSSGTGVNSGTGSSTGAEDSGAAYVFVRSGTSWSQEAYVKASNTGAGDDFGRSVSISADGATLAVGAPWEDSSATGVGGAEGNNGASASGAAYVFTRSGTTWAQRAYVKAMNTDAGDNFGITVALSGDGTRLAVGAIEEDARSASNPADNGAMSAGAVYVFREASGAWSQEAFVKASNADAGDFFGYSLAFSQDGATLAVGAEREDSNARNVGGDASNNSLDAAGAAYVFARSGTAWSQAAYVKASNTSLQRYFGANLALSADGLTLAVGARFEASAATGVGGNQNDTSASGAGAVYLYRFDGSWSHVAYVKASNTAASDAFGSSLALSRDGLLLAVSATGEDSGATGVGGNQNDNGASASGATYVFYGSP